MLRIFSTPLRVGLRGLASKAEVIDQASDAKQVCSSIASEVADARNRLFAIVYVNGRQWRISQGDLISLEGNTPLTVGDTITLDKVLMVGGSDFSVFGRPLLDPSTVSVKATVVEKSTKSPELHYRHRNHQQIKVIHWLTRETAVLRINEVTASANLTGPTQ